MTPAVVEIHKQIMSAFGWAFEAGLLRNGGIYNRRYIAGTTTWSQHAYSNAWDIMTDGGKDIGDRVYQYLIDMKAKSFPVGTILWQVTAHYDHIHVEGTPKRRGTPPVSAPPSSSFTSADRAAVAEIQKTLKGRGIYGADGKPLVIDGLPGANTTHAFNVLSGRWKP